MELLQRTGGRYDRLFPALAPLEVTDHALLAPGDLDGACDGAATSADGGGPAGWPFFGELVAHDITFDRSPRADLGCLYGHGPVSSPFLYQRDDPAKLLIGTNELGEPADLPRNHEGIALIADPRNDAQLFISQLHLALLKVHNGLVDRLRAQGTAERDLFEEAARATRWHYQWLLANAFLPAAAGSEIVREVLSQGPRLYLRDSAPFIPLEFSDGAFRYRHGQIRETYRINESAGKLSLFDDLSGFGAVPADRVVRWSLVFDMPGHSRAQRARRIDGKLASGLIHMPGRITGNGNGYSHLSLAARDLDRGSEFGLPSGEDVARAAGEKPLSPEELGQRDLEWPGQTPLWLYFMLESATRAGGNRLGPVGGRIVTEVLLGILDADPGSYRCAAPRWRPTLGSRGRFSIADLLQFAATVS